MAEHDNGKFDAGSYWRERVVSGSDLGVVGHRSMGLAYNAQIYERRIEVLNAMLARHSSKPFSELRVLDIGCGSGFYTRYWAEQGVRDYVGIDISSATIERLSQTYTDYEFINADITEDSVALLEGRSAFDIVTVFDVFYHIVDEPRFANAVRQIGAMTADSGLVLVMDQVCPQRYQLSKHVVYRQRDDYLKEFEDAHLGFVDSELLFHYLVPPLSGRRSIDLAAAGLFKSAGLVMRVSDRIASWTATRLRRLDSGLRASGRRVSNSEMFAFRKSRS